MQKFNSAGVEIAYVDEGRGDPVLLLHGFASNHRVNWVSTSWTKTLLEAGFRVIAFDHRGHGESEKLYDRAKYSASIMAEDAARLLDHLDIQQTHVVGYSMGARVAAFLLLQRPELVRKAVLAGLAERLVSGVPGAETIAEALEAPEVNDVTDPGARTFRVFADQTRSDLRALAACIRSSRVKIRPEALATIKVPVLVVAGSADGVAGEVQPLVDLIPGSKGLTLQGKNHMSAVGDLQFKRAAIAFFEEP
jgi:pimeloyl-ACP methyl ester carboxylesterase